MRQRIVRLSFPSMLLLLIEGEKLRKKIGDKGRIKAMYYFNANKHSLDLYNYIVSLH